MRCLFLLLSLLVLLTAALTCPELTCTEYLDPSICGYLDSSANAFNVKPCGPGLSCVPPNAMSDYDLLQCKPLVDNSAIQNLYQLKLSGVDIRKQGQSCYAPTDHCLEEYGLVCNCGTDCICVAGAQIGQSCSTLQCAWGASCFNDYCTVWFSQSYGTVVPDPLLCAAMQTDSSGACLRDDTTAKSIYEPCNADSDCTGNGNTRGHCRCGMLGNAYCDLKSSDMPNVMLKQAYLAGSVREILYWQNVVDNWAFLQRNNGSKADFSDFPMCADQVWPDLDFQFRQLPERQDFNSAYVFAVTTVFSSLFI